MQEIRDENNLLIGYYIETDNRISYSTYKYGLIGEFDKNTRQYYRCKTYPGATTSPWNGTDWGLADVMYWSKH